MFRQGFVAHATRAHRIQIQAESLHGARSLRRIWRLWYSATTKRQEEIATYNQHRRKLAMFRRWCRYAAEKRWKRAGWMLATRHCRLSALDRVFGSWRSCVVYAAARRLRLLAFVMIVSKSIYVIPSFLRWRDFCQRRRVLVRVFAISHEVVVQDDDIAAWDLASGARLERAANLRYRQQFRLLRQIVRRWSDWTRHVLLQRWRRRCVESMQRLLRLRAMTNIFYAWKQVTRRAPVRSTTEYNGWV